MREKPRQDDADEIHGEVSNHVRDQVPAPQVRDGQNSAQCECDNDVTPTAGPMAEREDEKRNRSCPISVQAKRLQSFNGVAAVEKFLDDSSAGDDQNEQPDR